MNEQHVDDLLDLYVLAALEPDEHAAVEAHLATCARCQAQLNEARRVVELLAWTPEQHDPPAYLRTRVLEHVARLQRIERPPQPSMWQRLQQALPLPMARVGWAVSAAMLVAALVLGGRAWQLQGQVHVLNTQLEQQHQQLAARDEQLAQQQALLDVLASPDVQVASLKAPQTSTEARAQLLFDAEGRRAYLVTSNLPPLPADKTYQLWLIDEQPNSAGLLSVNQQGTGSLLIEAQQPFESYKAVGISVEPAGGSSAPTPNAIVLLGEL
jgi:anti-sigma-K factor RskA